MADINTKFLQIIENTKSKPTKDLAIGSPAKEKQEGRTLPDWYTGTQRSTQVPQSDFERLYGYSPASMQPGEMDFISGWQANVYRTQFDENNQFLEDNQALGPGGDKLPYGARGWDWNAEPDYGDGFMGFAKGLLSRITAPMDEAEEELQGAQYNLSLIHI